MQLGTGLSLLLGGARSGKSDIAVQLGLAWRGGVTFVATATAGDQDMAQRIKRHQDDRPSDWGLVESPTFGASDVATVPAESLLLLDCVTLLVSNLMFADDTDDDVIAHAEALAAALAARPSPSIVISNEVGMGIHPDTALGRRYRDLLGYVNRVVARHSNAAAFVVAGKALPLQDFVIDAAHP